LRTVSARSEPSSITRRRPEIASEMRGTVDIDETAEILRMRCQKSACPVAAGTRHVLGVLADVREHRAVGAPHSSRANSSATASRHCSAVGPAVSLALSVPREPVGCQKSACRVSCRDCRPQP
jgi:hypothetical protein